MKTKTKDKVDFWIGNAVYAGVLALCVVVGSGTVLILDAVFGKVKGS